MDRRVQKSALTFLLVMLSLGAVGCRSTRDEVPPGRRHRQEHKPGEPAVEFSTQPPETAGLPGGPLGGGTGNIGPSNGGTSGLTPYGTGEYGPGKFGPPGSSGAVPGSETPSNLLGRGRSPFTPPPGNALDSVGGLPPGTP